MQLKKRLFNPIKDDSDFKLDQAVEDSEVSDPTCLSDSCIGNVRTSSRKHVQVSRTHTTARHATHIHTTTLTTLAWLLSRLFLLDSSQNDMSSSMSVSRTWQHPMVAVCGSDDDLLPTAALAVALTTNC